MSSSKKMNGTEQADLFSNGVKNSSVQEIITKYGTAEQDDLRKPRDVVKSHEIILNNYKRKIYTDN